MPFVKLYILAIIVFAGCGCISTLSVERKFEPLWLGRNFDEFVMQYGIPSRKFDLSNGDVAYTWNPGTKSVSMPISGTTNSSGYTQIGGGGSIDMTCELQILTDKSGVIKQVKIMKDSVGVWTTSRCHELLKHYSSK